jgi:hypothetical protein
MNDGTTVNIPADAIDESNGFFVITKNNEIVGAFEMTAIVCIYLSERRADNG